MAKKSRLNQTCPYPPCRQRVTRAQEVVYKERQLWHFPCYRAYCKARMANWRKSRWARIFHRKRK